MIALIVLTVFYITNLMGIEGAAKLQNAMMLIMILALTAFIVFGLPHVTPTYFEQPEDVYKRQRECCEQFEDAEDAVGQYI